MKQSSDGAGAAGRSRFAMGNDCGEDRLLGRNAAQLGLPSRARRRRKSGRDDGRVNSNEMASGKAGAVQLLPWTLLGRSDAKASILVGGLRVNRESLGCLAFQASILTDRDPPRANSETTQNRARRSLFYNWGRYHQRSSCPARVSTWRCFCRMTYCRAGSSRRRYAEAKDGSSYWSVNSRAFAYPMTGHSQPARFLGI